MPIVYTADPDNASQPADNFIAAGGAPELRALKNKVNNLAITQGVKLSRSQTVLTGATTAAGDANILSAGAGLSVNLLATAVAVRTAFAYGMDGSGNVDFIATTSADQNIASLPTNSTVYPYIDRNVSNGTLTYGFLDTPPQYVRAGNGMPQASLLHFEGSLADDYGATGWTLLSGATISATQSVFGTQSLSVTSTAGSCAENATDSVDLSLFDKWTIEGRVRFNAAGVASTFCSASNGIGAVLRIGRNTSNRFLLALGTNGTAQDIANDVTGTTTTITANTWFAWALSFDGSTYKLRINGVTEITVTSSTKIGNAIRMALGSGYVLSTAGSPTGTGSNGFIDEFRISAQNRYTADYTPATVAFTADETWYVYRIVERKAYMVGASSTAVQRVIVGQCTTDGSGVTSVTSYQFLGKTVIDSAALAVSQAQSFNHNIGAPVLVSTHLVNLIPDQGYVVDDVLTTWLNDFDGTNLRRWGVFADSLSLRQNTNAAVFGIGAAKTGVVSVVIVMARWKMRHYVTRAFD